MTEFKFIVNQIVLVDSKNRILKDKQVKVVSRHKGSWDDLDDGTERNWYKVSGEDIHSLSFFEDQLKEVTK